MGRLSKSFDRGLLLSLGMGLWSAALALLVAPLALDLSPLALLLASALVGGLASSFYHPIGASIIASTFAPRLGLALGINGASGALGRSMYALAVPSAAAFSTLALYFLPAAAAACSAAAAAALRGLAGPEAGGGASEPSEGGQRARAGGGSLIAVVALLTAFSFTRNILGQGFITFLPSFLSKELGLAYGPEVGLATMIATIGAIASQPLLGILSDFLGRLRTLILTTIMSSASVAGFVILASRGETMLAMIPLAGFGVFAFEAFTVTLAYVSELVSPGGAIFANSIVWGVGLSAGGAAGPAVVGVLASWASLGEAFVLLSLINLVSLAPLLLVGLYSRRLRATGV